MEYKGYFVQQGWQCPICGRVYSPTTLMCISCPPKTTTAAGTAQTETQIYKKDDAGRVWTTIPKLHYTSHKEYADEEN